MKAPQYPSMTDIRGFPGRAEIPALHMLYYRKFRAYVLLTFINPAVKAVQGDYTPRSSQNAEFVQAVAEMNVLVTMQTLRDSSAVLRELIDKGEIGLVGAMYDVSSGKVNFYD